MPAKACPAIRLTGGAGIQLGLLWMPACAGMTLFLLTAVNVAADSSQENLSARLKDIYTSYKTNPSASCNQLQEIIQSQNLSTLPSSETKAAYYFLANCHYMNKDFEKAVEYYLKTAELSPDDPQPWLDAGSVYLKAGRYADAQKDYREALKRVSHDEAQETKISQMIENVPGVLQRNYTFTTGIIYDSNVNSGPANTVHILYGGYDYALGSQDKPRDDFYFYNNIDADLSKALDPKTYLLFNIGASNTSYFNESDFNSSIFSSSVGYKKIFGGKSVTVSPFINYQIFDDASYQISHGLNLSGAAKVTPKINLWPYASFYNQSFYNDNDRDALGVTVGSSGSYELNSKTSLVESFFYSHTNAKNNQYTYDSVFVGSSINRTFSQLWKAALGYNLQLSYYDAMDPTFGSARKDDGHTVYLSLDYSLIKFLKMKNATLNCSVSYNQNNSNHSFQDFDRLFSGLKLTFRF